MGATSTAGRNRWAGRAAAALAAAVLAAGCGSGHPDSPHPTAISPASGSQAVPVPVRIRGEGFGAGVTADLAGGGGVVDARFQALLGDTPLVDVALQQDGSIAATVPAGLAPGTYDLTVVGPDGRAGTLAQAYRVVAPGGTSAAVAAYRIEPVGPQVAYQPFTVAVTAVDATGAVVPDYAGSAAIADGTGTAVPGRVGLFAEGRWTGAVEVRAASAADVLTVTDASGASGRSAAFAVSPSPAVAVQFDSPASAAAAGECAGPVTLSLSDAFGEPTTAAADAALSLSGAPAPGFAVFSDAACAVARSPVVPAGAGTVSVWFAATTAGALDLTASGGRLSAAAQTWSVAAGPPAVLAFQTLSQGVKAGRCSRGVTVEVRDAYGNRSPGGVAAVDLAATPPTGVELFSDSCGTSAASLAVPVGVTTTAFHFRGRKAGRLTLGVSAPGLAGASQDEDVEADAAVAIAFVTPPRAAAAGACSEALTVEVRDSYGNPVAGASPVALSLGAAPSASFAFHADRTCAGAAVSGVTVPAGASEATLYYRGTAPGDVAVTVSSAGLSAADQVERVDGGSPAALVFASAPQAIPVNGCSAAVEIALVDAFGNPAATVTPLHVRIDATPSAGVGLFSDAACSVPASRVTIPAGSDAGAFHFSAAQPGPVVLSIAAGSLAGATQAEAVTSAPPDRISFVTGPRTVEAGACSGPVTIEAEDAWGNPSPISSTATTPVVLGGAGLTFHAGGACGGGAPSFAAGATSATFSFRRTVAGTGAVVVTATAGTLTGSQTETIVAAPAAQLAFTTAPQTVAAGSCSDGVALEARDLYGNPTALSTTAVTTLGLSGASLGFSAGPGCGGGAPGFAAGATSATFSFRRAAAGVGAVTVTATAAGLSQTQVETIVAAPAAQLAFTTAPQTVAAGSCSDGVALEARDLYGNPTALSTTAVTALGLSGANLAFSAGSGCGGGAPGFAAGAASTTFSFRRAAAGVGTVTVTATAAGLSQAQVETIVAAPATQLAFTTSPQTVVAGACSGDVALETRDLYGNPSALSTTASTAVGLAGTDLVFSAGAGCGGGAPGFAAGATGTTFSFRRVVTGTGPVLVTASAGGLSQAQTEVVVAAPATQLVFTTAPQVVAAGDCSGDVGLATRDLYGNPSPISTTATTAIGLGGTDLVFSAGAGCGGGAPAFGSGGTTATFSFRRTVGGTGSVSVTATAASLTAGQTETIVAATPAQLVFTSPARTVAAGACSADVTLETRDAYGNPSALSTTAVTTVGLSGTALDFSAGGGCGGGAAGFAAGATSATFSFRRAAAGVGTVTVTATAGALSQSQVETIVAAPPAQLVFTTSAQTVRASACSGDVTLEARDLYGNPSAISTTATTGVVLSGTDLDFSAGSGCGGGAASFAPGATTATFSFRRTVAGIGAVVVTATAGGLSQTQTETLVAATPTQLVFTSAAQTVAAGACSGDVTLEARDLYGNPSAISTTAATAVGLAGTNLSFSGGSGCGGGAASFAAGATGATFSFRRAVAGTGAVTVTATAGGLSATQVETIVLAAPTQLVFTSGAQTVAAGACSGAVTLETRDLFGDPSPISTVASTALALSGTNLLFFAGTGCTGGPPAFAAGATTATLSFRRAAAGVGAVLVTASAVPLTATQTETIVVGPVDHLAWGAIASPELVATTFAVSLSARDACGNVAPYTGTATLSASAGLVGCASGCTSQSVTAAFAAGTWTGTVMVSTEGTGVTLTATAGAVTGTSNAFDVTEAAAPRSPPVAAFATSSRVIVSGGAMSFDAGASSDAQSTAASLQVSWDFAVSSYADFASSVAAAYPPWSGSPWTTTKTVTHTYTLPVGSPGAVYRPRLAVRDAAGDLAFASGLVVVVPDPADICTVDTASLADDSATSCTSKGIDGALSLTEAVRLANAPARTRPLNITFDPSRVTTISSPGVVLTVSRAARILGRPGVVLSGVSLDLAADDVIVSGLELANLGTPITVRNQSASDALLEDVVVHDGQGILVRGHARLHRVQLSRCAGTCVRENGAAAYLAVFGSDFRGSGADVGVALDACAAVMPVQATASPYEAWTSGGWSSTGAAALISTVFTGFDTAVTVASSGSCQHPFVTNVTFDGNATGIWRDISGAASGIVVDNVFSRNTVTAVAPDACWFMTMARNVAWLNASPGCISPDGTEYPQYLSMSGRDFRIRYTSPLRDRANAANRVEVDGPGPGLFLGAGPDRGGRETF